MQYIESVESFHGFPRISTDASQTVNRTSSRRAYRYKAWMLRCRTYGTELELIVLSILVQARFFDLELG